MPIVTEIDREQIKLQIRRYIALQGGRRVTNVELADKLQRDQEFIAELRREIIKQDLESFDKRNLRLLLAETRGGIVNLRKELWSIASRKDDAVSVREKISALREIKHSFFSEVELYQSTGVIPRTIHEADLKEPESMEFNVVELLEQILEVLASEDRSKVCKVVGDYIDAHKVQEAQPTIPAVAS